MATPLKIGYQLPLTVNGYATHSVGDVTAGNSYTEIEVKRKGDRKVRYVKGMQDKPIDFDIDFNELDPAYRILKLAENSDDAVTVNIAGVEDRFIVTKFERNEPVDDIVTVGVSIKLATPDADDLNITSLGLPPLPPPPAPPEPE